MTNRVGTGARSETGAHGGALHRARPVGGRRVRGYYVFRAAYSSRCGACQCRILPGQQLRFDVGFSTAVHADCERSQLSLVAAAEACETTQQRVIDRNGGELPHGLRPGTLSTYSAEWQRYVALAQRLGFDPDVPGRDVPWNPYLLWRFMQWRAESCKPTTVFAAVSALAHFGRQCRFLLPTKKEDGHAMFHRDIAKMKKEISLYHSSKMGHAGATYAVDHSTPLGFASVALIFSAFAVYNERSFLRLSRCDRHHLWAVVAQHARSWHAVWPLHLSYLHVAFVCA